MRIGLYSLPSLVPMAAFAAGLGSAAVWRNHNHYAGEVENFDAVVVYGTRNAGAKIVAAYSTAGIPCVVIDHGYLHRVHTPDDYETGHFQVSVGSLGWMPLSAPGDRFERLGIAIRTRPERINGPAVICGQVPDDPSHGLTEKGLRSVYAEIARQIRRQGLDVEYRLHPERGVPIDGVPVAVGDLATVIDRARVVITLNSNSGLDALIAGAPVVTWFDAPYSEVAARWPADLATVAPPSPDALRAYLNRVAYAQWTAAEMRAGLPQTYLRSIGALP